MAEDTSEEETLTFGKLIRSQSHYGTSAAAAPGGGRTGRGNCVAVARPRTFIRHAVSGGETLQGIALKYGVTVSIYRLYACSKYILYTV